MEKQKGSFECYCFYKIKNFWRDDIDFIKKGNHVRIVALGNSDLSLSNLEHCVMLTYSPKCNTPRFIITEFLFLQLILTWSFHKKLPYNNVHILPLNIENSQASDTHSFTQMQISQIQTEFPYFHKSFKNLGFEHVLWHMVHFLSYFVYQPIKKRKWSK